MVGTATTIASRLAVVSSATLVLFWAATRHRFLLHPEALPSYAWAGSIVGYALYRPVPKTKTLVLATGVAALLSWTLAAVLLIGGLIWPNGTDDLLPLAWVQCGMFIWAANLSVVALRLRSPNLDPCEPRSRITDRALRVARVSAVAVVVPMAVIGLGTLLYGHVPDWVRHGLMPAAAVMTPWLGTVTVAIVACTAAHPRAVGVAVTAAVVICACVGTENGALLAFVLNVALLGWMNARRPAPRVATGRG